MADLMQTRLASPLAGRIGDSRMREMPRATRVSLRLKPEAIETAGATLEVDLTLGMNRATESGSRTAIRLGPDEFLLIAPVADTWEAFEAALAAVLTPRDYALTDISHRQLGVSIEGPDCTAMLNALCPLDLDLAAFPVGMATRTLFGKADIVLWRTAETRFHIEVWRSFAPYLWGLLATIGREYPDQCFPGAEGVI